MCVYIFVCVCVCVRARVCVSSEIVVKGFAVMQINMDICKTKSKKLDFGQQEKKKKTLIVANFFWEKKSCLSLFRLIHILWVWKIIFRLLKIILKLFLLWILCFFFLFFLPKQNTFFPPSSAWSLFFKIIFRRKQHS